MHHMKLVNQPPQYDDLLKLKGPQKPMQRIDQLQQGFGQLELDEPMRRHNIIMINK